MNFVRHFQLQDTRSYSTPVIASGSTSNAHSWQQYMIFSRPLVNRCLIIVIGVVESSHTNFRGKAPPGLNFNSHTVCLVMIAECPVVETSYCSLTRDDWWCVFPSLFVPRIIEASPSSPRFSLEDSMRICPLSGIGGGLVHIARMRLKVEKVCWDVCMALFKVWMSDHFCVGFSWFWFDVCRCSAGSAWVPMTICCAAHECFSRLQFIHGPED